MKNPTQKSIKKLSIATLIIGGLTLAYTYWEMIAQLWVDSYINPLTWNPDATLSPSRLSDVTSRPCKPVLPSRKEKTKTGK